MYIYIYVCVCMISNDKILRRNHGPHLLDLGASNSVGVRLCQTICASTCIVIFWCVFRYIYIYILHITKNIFRQLYTFHLIKINYTVSIVVHRYIVSYRMPWNNQPFSDLLPPCPIPTMEAPQSRCGSKGILKACRRPHTIQIQATRLTTQWHV